MASEELIFVLDGDDRERRAAVAATETEARGIVAEAFDQQYQVCDSECDGENHTDDCDTTECDPDSLELRGVYTGDVDLVDEYSTDPVDNEWTKVHDWPK